MYSIYSIHRTDLTNEWDQSTIRGPKTFTPISHWISLRSIPSVTNLYQLSIAYQILAIFYIKSFLFTIQKYLRSLTFPFPIFYWTHINPLLFKELKMFVPYRTSIWQVSPKSTSPHPLFYFTFIVIT